MHAVFDESQVFRIDHLLGKESVDNILAFRSAVARHGRARPGALPSQPGRREILREPGLGSK
jgi:hypothetical protein